MHILKGLIVSLILSIPIMVSAILPPFFQNTRELIAVLQDPRLKKAFGSGQVIQTINAHENTYMLIGSKGRIVEFKVNYLKSDSKVVGKPADFELEFIDYDVDNLAKEFENTGVQK
jgi:hypothetical protein